MDPHHVLGCKVLQLWDKLRHEFLLGSEGGSQWAKHWGAQNLRETNQPTQGRNGVWVCGVEGECDVHPWLPMSESLLKRPELRPWLPMVAVH